MKHSPGFLRIVAEALKRVGEVDVTTARERQKHGAHLVDVREESEWNAGHAANAQHIGKGVIERDIETRIPDKNAEIILYCGGGYRSVLAAESLRQMGYTNVRSMAGGWRAWVKEGAPTGT
ncbi:MAG TPA: rhodanese-like domain-containing protein [Gemmatimonadaceae bacterium]|nr:rhodanese-like domain-containing protein [Gemmatimonadaceae bacterium]